MSDHISHQLSHDRMRERRAEAEQWRRSRDGRRVSGTRGPFGRRAGR